MGGLKMNRKIKRNEMNKFQKLYQEQLDAIKFQSSAYGEHKIAEVRIVPLKKVKK
jgi:hypothetical protein